MCLVALPAGTGRLDSRKLRHRPRTCLLLARAAQIDFANLGRDRLVVGTVTQVRPPAAGPLGRPVAEVLGYLHLARSAARVASAAPPRRLRQSHDQRLHLARPPLRGTATEWEDVQIVDKGEAMWDVWKKDADLVESPLDLAPHSRGSACASQRYRAIDPPAA